MKKAGAISDYTNASSNY